MVTEVDVHKTKNRTKKEIPGAGNWEEARQKDGEKETKEKNEDD